MYDDLTYYYEPFEDGYEDGSTSMDESPCTAEDGCTCVFCISGT